MTSPRVCFYADDFTGAVDALLQLTRGGWRGRLLLGPVDRTELRAQAAGQDVLGVAGTARSLAPGELEAEVRPVLAALAALGPEVVQYKACSTADSSPQVGSLGRVLEIGRELFGQDCVPLLFAQPDFGRYTVFGHHFAAEAGTVHRLDRQPTMSTHPVTPMRESDLALHLGRQTALPVGSLPWTGYTDAAAITRALQEAPEAGLVLDALTGEHLQLVAAGVLGLRPDTSPDRPPPVFAVGAGGLGTGLAAVMGGAATSAPAPTPRAPDGPVLAVSGSCSPQTLRQVEHARTAGWLVLQLPLDDPDPLAAIGEPVLTALSGGRSVVVASAADGPGETPVAVAEVAGRLAGLTRAAVTAGLTSRVVVCGGDTSSRITTLLTARSLEVVANPVDNVVLCRLTTTDPALDGLEVLLKGGQVGPVDLFELVRTLGGST